MLSFFFPYFFCGMSLTGIAASKTMLSPTTVSKYKK